jgi:hypothetical protein
MSVRRLAIAVLAFLCSIVGQCVATGAYALAAGAPLVDDESTSAVGMTSATLKAAVNPNEAATTYHFEYGVDSTYGTNVPVPDAEAGSGGEDVEVTSSIGGLRPGVVYHYRVVATSPEGITNGGEKTFTTFGAPSPEDDTCPNALIRQMQFSSYLPECRAYEMVSPLEKSGGNVAADPRHTQSAADGNAVKYTSPVAFGDAPGIEARGAEYVSQRGPEGWSTHAINPLQDEGPVTLYASSVYVGFSEDLSHGVYFARFPITPGHPNVEKVGNLYLRSDILTGFPGSYDLLSDASEPVPARPLIEQNQDIDFDGASADWTRFIFETPHNLTPNTATLSPSAPKLYEWNKGVVSLAGVLPDGSPAENSVAGGSSLGTYTQARHTISADGSHIIFESGALNEGLQPEKGNIYIRIDGSETVQLNVSERSEPEPGDTQPATFMDATPDDSKVLFATAGSLTDNAGGGVNLYMYDANAPSGKHLTLLSVDDEPNGVLSDGVTVVGASEDLSYIYFVDDNKLLAGQADQPNEGQLEQTMLYVWHEGTIRHIMNSPWFRLELPYPWGERGPLVGETGVRVTADGKRVVFTSSSSQLANQLGYDNRLAPGAAGKLEVGNCSDLIHCKELYLYSYDTDQLTCVSCDPTGARPVGDAKFERLADVYPAYGFSWPSQLLNHPFTEEGRYIFFDTSDALVPQDTNGLLDVYEYDDVTRRMYLISSGMCSCGSEFVNADRNGHNVFIVTHQSLVRSDVDTNGDLYDARVDGGIEAQNRPPVAPCESDDCQGPAKLAPVFSLPASSSFSGLGNAAPVSKSVARVLPRGVTRLTRALRECKRKPKSLRVKCRRRARQKYGKKSVSHPSLRAGR